MHAEQREQVKTEIVRFRVSSQEKRRLKRAARRVQRDLSDWLRDLALRAARRFG